MMHRNISANKSKFVFHVKVIKEDLNDIANDMAQKKFAELQIVTRLGRECIPMKVDRLGS